MRIALLLPVLLVPSPLPAQTEAGAPEDTLRTFLKAMQALDFDRAGGLVKGFDAAAPAWIEVRKLMDTGESRRKGAPELQGLSLGPCKVQRTGDRAEVDLALFDAQRLLLPEGRVDERVALVLVQGKWLLAPPAWTWKAQPTGLFGRVAPLMTAEGAAGFLRDHQNGLRASAVHQQGELLHRTFREAVQRVWEVPDPAWGEGPGRTQAVAAAALRLALTAPSVGTLKNPYQPEGKAWTVGPAKVGADQAGTVFIDLSTVRRKEEPGISLTIVYLDREERPASRILVVPVE